MHILIQERFLGKIIEFSNYLDTNLNNYIIIDNDNKLDNYINSNTCATYKYNDKVDYTIDNWNKKLDLNYIEDMYKIIDLYITENYLYNRVPTINYIFNIIDFNKFEYNGIYPINNYLTFILNLSIDDLIKLEYFIDLNLNNNYNTNPILFDKSELLPNFNNINIRLLPQKIQLGRYRINFNTNLIIVPKYEELKVRLGYKYKLAKTNEWIDWIKLNININNLNKIKFDKYINEVISEFEFVFEIINIKSDTKVLMYKPILTLR